MIWRLGIAGGAALVGYLLVKWITEAPDGRHLGLVGALAGGGLVGLAVFK